MNPEELKAYKREKSRLFNANLRELRLKEKKRTADQQPDNQDDNQGNLQDDNQDDNQDDVLSLQDLMDIFETLDTKLDLLETKLETIIETKLENKLYELLDKLDKLDKFDKLENKQPQPSIFFAWIERAPPVL